MIKYIEFNAIEDIYTIDYQYGTSSLGGRYSSYSSVTSPVLGKNSGYLKIFFLGSKDLWQVNANTF
jgi:hypothetical protein